MRRPLLCLVLLAALAPSAFAQSPSPADAPAADAAPTGQLTKPPALLKFVEAVYPKDAEARRLTGSVGLLVDVDETGAVTRAELVEPAGEGFDEAALAAVRQFQFSPAEIDGKPAPVRIGYRYNFVLQPEAPPPAAARAPAVNFRGRVLRRGDRAPVVAEVAVGDGAFNTSCDAQGRFELAGLPAGKHRVVAIAPGYERFETEEEIVEGQSTEVVYHLRQRIFSPFETVVRGQRERKEVARVELQQEEIRLIPGTNGDVFKVVQNLPGVSRAPYGFGLIAVRGGRAFDTRVYVDGIWIPTIFHFGGLTSVYNSDLVGNLSFQPGNFSARYGRAVAGAIEAESRAPSREGYHGYLNTNLMDTTALVEGPLGGDWSFATAGRVSYVDLVLTPFLPSSLSVASAPRYWDYQALADWAPKGGRDQVRLSAFGSNDSLKVLLNNPAMVDPEGRVTSLGASIGFHRLMGSWTHAFSPLARNKLTLALGADLAASSFGADIRSDSGIYTAQLRDAFTVELSRSLSLELGTDSYLGFYDVDVVTSPMPLPGELPDPFTSRQLLHALEQGPLIQPALYAEAVYTPFEGTRLVPGLRLDYDGVLGYFALDPRLAAFQQLGERTLLKAAVGLYQQPPDFRSGQFSPTFGNPDLGAERSFQAMAGVERKFTEALSLDLQLYYKQMSRLAVQSARTIERDGQPALERWANAGEGRAYGAELLLRHALTRNFFGWVAYSLSRAERFNPLSSSPAWRLNALDQPHHLTVVASYKWPRDWITGVRLQYVTGGLTTPVVGSIYDADADRYVPLGGQALSERMPSFLSLDLRVDKRFVFQDWTIATYLDVQNVTNNENAETWLYNYDYTKRELLRGLPIFPSVGLKAEF